MRDPSVIPGANPPASAVDLPSKFSHATKNPAVVHATRESGDVSLIMSEVIRDQRRHGPQVPIIMIGEVGGNAKQIPAIWGPR